MCGRICSIVHFWWNLHYWQQLYTTGNNFTLLATILHYWQQFYTTGNNLTLLATILHYWQQFYTAGKHFLLLATILQYWQQSYTAGNNFTLRTTDGSTGSDKYHLLSILKIEMNFHKINKRSCANLLVFHIFKFRYAMLIECTQLFRCASIS